MGVTTGRPASWGRGMVVEGIRRTTEQMAGSVRSICKDGGTAYKYDDIDFDD